MIIPDINPVAIQIGPFALHWYALTWLAGFGAVYWLGVRRGRVASTPWNSEQVGDLILMYGVLGALLGGRMGYVLFYGWQAWSADFWWAFKIWQGGMSFHGGLLGVVLAMFLYARRTGRNFWDITDTFIPAVPVALGTVRIGNFINGELPGRVTDVPWAVIYQGSDALPRHPSQLYQAFCEGVILGITMWLFAAKPRVRGLVSAAFLIGYGVFRWFTEWFREPDAHIGFDIGDLITRGQILSLPLIIAGVILWWFAQRGRL